MNERLYNEALHQSKIPATLAAERCVEICGEKEMDGQTLDSLADMICGDVY